MLNRHTPSRKCGFHPNLIQIETMIDKKIPLSLHIVFLISVFIPFPATLSPLLLPLLLLSIWPPPLFFPPHFSPLRSIIHFFYSPSFILLSPLSAALSFCSFEPPLLETSLLSSIYLSIYLFVNLSVNLSVNSAHMHRLL